MRPGVSGQDAVIDPDERLTDEQLDTSTRELASTLIGAGIGTGTRVALMAPNSVRWVQLSLAITRIGAVLVPLSTLLRARELHAQLATARVEVLITVEEFRGHRYLDELAEWVGSDVLPTGGERLLERRLPSLRSAWTPTNCSPPPVPTSREHRRRTCLGGHTRRSPGHHLHLRKQWKPWGVNHSHESALFAVQSGQEARLVGPDTRLYLPMPFFWVGGFGAASCRRCPPVPHW